METELFNRQYIISKKELALNGWKQFLFDNYHVYVHPNLDYVHQDGKHLSVADWVICLTIGILNIQMKIL